MKIYISADMEGITTTTQANDCLPGTASYPYHARQMTAEVSYHKHFMAEKMSYFPGARKINANTISYSADNYFDIKRFFSFVL